MFDVLCKVGSFNLKQFSANFFFSFLKTHPYLHCKKCNKIVEFADLNQNFIILLSETIRLYKSFNPVVNYFSQSVLYIYVCVECLSIVRKIFKRLDPVKVHFSCIHSKQNSNKINLLVQRPKPTAPEFLFYRVNMAWKFLKKYSFCSKNAFDSSNLTKKNNQICCSKVSKIGISRHRAYFLSNRVFLLRSEL